MAINTLEYAKIFMTTLDKQLIAEATSGWMEPNASRVIYNGGDEVKIPKISTSGLGDYDRNKGFTQGAVTLSYETMKMTQDRAQSFQLDAMDVNETNFVASAGQVMGEFQRMHVAPEIDAYRYSTIAAKAAAKGLKTEGTITKANVIATLLDDIAQIRDKTGYGAELVITMSGLMLPILEQAEAFQRSLPVNDFKKGEINMKVRSIDGCPILFVPSARMKTEYTFKDGSSGQGGGFEATGSAKNINWLIMPRNAPIAVSKTDVTRIFDPMTNQQAHAWKIDYRKYHDLWMMENQLAAVLVNKEGE